MNVGESFLTWSIMKSLPSQFDLIKSSYNTQDVEWTLDKMTSILVKEKDDISLRVSSGPKQFKKKATNFKPNLQSTPSTSSTPSIESFKGKCNLCHKIGYKRADCWKFKGWLERKGELVLHFEFNMIKTNIVDVQSNYWWLDTDATIHLTNSLQGLTNQRNPTSL